MHYLSNTRSFFRFVLALLVVITLLPIDDSFAARRKKARKPVYYAPPYAAFIVDADRGTVLYEKNADAVRYPASLTKMMTLYLTFDALKKGKLKLDQRLRVSQKAARQPQTNIALRPGDTITVKTAIHSLVVRSANDAALVLGEALAGSEWNFGVMMTNKARQLGMHNTVFRNASGLPNAAQHTTARDMAKLGIALKKNFPEFYPVFSLRSFTYRGRTYKSHNHVLGRMEGADGIKTGYTNASGFNLVTSVRRGGVNLVGVVIGGRSARARDDDMVRLMQSSFTRLTGKPVRIMEAKADLPETEGTPNVDIAVKDSIYETTRSDFLTIKPAKKSTSGIWGIQVGAFIQRDDAMEAIQTAMQIAEAELAESTVSLGNGNEGKQIHRARLVDLSEKAARTACKKILAQNEACFVYKTNG